MQAPCPNQKDKAIDTPRYRKTVAMVIMIMDLNFKLKLRLLHTLVMTLIASIFPLFAASISGRVTSESSGVLLENIVVELYQDSGGEWIFRNQTQTSLQGIYQHDDLPDGTYLVHFRGGLSYTDEYYDGAPSQESATSVVIEGGVDQPDIDASLLSALGSVSGTVTGPDGLTPLAGVYVVLHYGYYGADGQWFSPRNVGAYTGADGSYRFVNLDEYVTYRVGFFDNSETYGTQYHDNASGLPLATDVFVAPGQETRDIDASLLLLGVAWPEIVVQETDRRNLTDGTALVSFGDSVPGVPVTKTLVIRNSGAADLTGLAVTISGPDASAFVVSGLGAVSLASGANTTFTVTFTPTAEGPRSAALAIASNDANENPFDIALAGNGLPPLVPEIVVEEPVGTELEDGVSTVAFGGSFTGEPVTKTLTIRNTGTGDLTDVAVTLSGTDASDFALGAPGAVTVAPGESTTFTITFTPSEDGARNASVEIVSNDADENPFEIALGGTGLVRLVPDIAVEHPPGTHLRDGSSTLFFGNSRIGVPVTKTITVSNTGVVALTGLALSITGVSASEFRVSELDTYRLAPGASTSVTVTFMPTVGGYSISTLQIASNDADESPFGISLVGIGLFSPASEIVVEHPVGSSLVDGASALAFGRSMVGTPIRKTITVRNSGSAALTGLAVTSRGMDASDFVVSALGSNTLASGAAITFTVTFRPSAAGTRRAEIRIASNDVDENPFDIAMTGVGKITTAPEITVRQGEGPKSDLKRNRSKRDFGAIEVDTTSEAMVFAIKNDGTSPLKKLDVTIQGKQAKEFEIVFKPLKSVDPGKTTRFMVTYRPGRAKASKAILQISSNDEDENPFRVTLTGKGTK
jgi:Abnormal spindle-like microcephaly-assoc'd, ASPM-SPD-2-Hydin